MLLKLKNKQYLLFVKSKSCLYTLLFGLGEKHPSLSKPFLKLFLKKKAKCWEGDKLNIGFHVTIIEHN